MKVVFLTAGAAGMYCGSCMHDNALARALRRQGVDCLLQPTYTPIRTDEPSVANDQLFFGGIQIYLLQVWPWLSRVPQSVRRILDWTPLVKVATRRAAATDASSLGDLALAMLRGEHGNLVEEVDRLTTWLADSIQPDVVIMSNLMIGGALPEIRRHLPNCRTAVLLQGDDIFLDHLPDAYREPVLGECRRLQQHVDSFITNSRFYARKMGELFAIDEDRIHVMPLSIDTGPFLATRETSVAVTPSKTPGRFRLGYLARVAPEKGLHHLVDAFIRLAKQPMNADLFLEVAGWLGEQHRPYLNSLEQKIRQAGLVDRFRYYGSPDLAAKVDFLRSLDLLCVPTDYEDPKGLFVLEANASGVCALQPDRGAFAELLSQTGGGITFVPDGLDSLCQSIQELKDNPERRQQLAEQGRLNVHQNHTIDVAAQTLVRLVGKS